MRGWLRAIWMAGYVLARGNSEQRHALRMVIEALYREVTEK